MHEPSPWTLKDIRISRLLCDEEDINVTFNYVFISFAAFPPDKDLSHGHSYIK